MTKQKLGQRKRIFDNEVSKWITAVMQSYKINGSFIRIEHALESLPDKKLQLTEIILQLMPSKTKQQ